MTIAQLFEYDNGEGDKLVPLPLLLWVQKNSINKNIKN